MIKSESLSVLKDKNMFIYLTENKQETSSYEVITSFIKQIFSENLENTS